MRSVQTPEPGLAEEIRKASACFETNAARMKYQTATVLRHPEHDLLDRALQLELGMEKIHGNTLDAQRGDSVG